VTGNLLISRASPYSAQGRLLAEWKIVLNACLSVAEAGCFTSPQNIQLSKSDVKLRKGGRGRRPPLFPKWSSVSRLVLACREKPRSHPFVQKADERMGHPCFGRFCFLRMNRDSKTARCRLVPYEKFFRSQVRAASGLKGWIPGRQGGSSAEV